MICPKALGLLVAGLGLRTQVDRIAVSVLPAVGRVAFLLHQGLLIKGWLEDRGKM